MIELWRRNSAGSNCSFASESSILIYEVCAVFARSVGFVNIRFFSFCMLVESSVEATVSLSYIVNFETSQVCVWFKSRNILVLKFCIRSIPRLSMYGSLGSCFVHIVVRIRVICFISLAEMRFENRSKTST